MHPSDKGDCNSTQESQAFDPSPFLEDDIAHPESEGEKTKIAENGTANELEEEKEQTEVAAKEALLRVTRGQL
jgi:hypothetical protein